MPVKNLPSKTQGQRDDADVVRFIERVGPFHGYGLDALAGLSLAARQGDNWDYVRLDFELSCGTAPLRLPQIITQVSLRTCFVELRRENCDLIPHKRYEHFLVEGDLKITREASVAKGSTFQAEAELGAEAKVSLLKATAALFGKVRGQAKGGRTSDEKTSETSRPRVELIVTAGQDRWRIGDPVRGDARRADGKLSGSYFGEDRASDGEAKPLCVIARRGKDRIVEATVIATAPVSQLIIEAAQGPPSTGIVSALRKKAGKATKAHAAALQELRGRMAGVVVGTALKALAPPKEISVPDGCLIIGLATLRLSGTVGVASDGD